MKYSLLGLSFFCGANAMAQADDAKEVKAGMELTTELQATDKDKYNYVSLLRLNVSLPVSSNISIDIASINTCMTASESIGCDLQTFSNIDAGNILFALSTCGIGWQIDNANSLFVGIRNMNEDYFTSPVTSFFTNSSCGIYPTISANYPIANYPVASIGLHYCYDVNPIKVQASLYNGTGYNRFTGRDNVFRVCPKDDGVFGITEVAYTTGNSSYFLGNALYWKDGMSATPWFYTEQSMSNNLTLLAGYSHSFVKKAECKDFIGLGAHYDWGRCQVGVFTDYAAFVGNDEFATELSCTIPLSTYIDIQPTVHLISTAKTFQGAGMLRMALSL